MRICVSALLCFVTNQLSEIKPSPCQASLGEVYLDPSNQLLPHQGKSLCKHALEAQARGFSQAANAKGDMKSLFVCQPPKSVFEYHKEIDGHQQEMDRQKQDAAAKVAALEAKRANADEFDQLLDELADDDDEDQPGPNRRRRPAGLASGSLATQPPAAKSSSSKAKSGQQKGKQHQVATASNASTAAPSELQAALSSHAHAPDGQSSSAKGSKPVLDAEMAMVANKHLGSDRGSSTKALQNLVPEFFLTSGEKRYTQSAKLRGVSCSVSLLILQE